MNYQRGPIEIRETTDADLVAVKDRLLDCDVLEIREDLGIEPYDALVDAKTRSTLCATFLHRGVPVLIFGVVPGEHGTGSAWMLVTKQLSAIKIGFIKISRQVIQDMLAQYPVIWNQIHTQHQSVIAWLKWCGATFSQASVDGKVTFFLRRSA